MVNLFLTSEAHNILDRFVEIFEINPSELTVAFIPTAADFDENKSYVDLDRNKLLELGFKVSDINIAEMTENYLQKRLEKADIIFVSGGNTFYLLEKSISSGFDKIVKRLVERGVYYIGSSAGSVLAGRKIEHVKLLDNAELASNLKIYDGLKLIDAMILPHYGNKKYEARMNQIVKNYAAQKNKIITLTDNQAVIVKDGKFRIISNDSY